LRAAGGTTAVTIFVTGSVGLHRSSHHRAGDCVAIGCNVRRLSLAERKLAYGLGSAGDRRTDSPDGDQDLAHAVAGESARFS
jgi:hypothetical protein